MASPYLLRASPFSQHRRAQPGPPGVSQIPIQFDSLPAGSLAHLGLQAGPGPLSDCAVAFAADRRLPALDADLPERCDHVVCRSLGDLNEREAIGDLDRADLPAGQVRLAGDDADEILRPDPGRTAGPHE